MFYSFKKINRVKNSGFSLLEVLIYVASLIFVLAIVTNTFLLMSKSYVGIKISQNINNSAINILERMTREIRWSSGVDSMNSVFNLNSGVLILNTVDNLGEIVEKQFYLENGSVMIKEGTDEPKSLNTGDVQVNKMFLVLGDSGVSTAIKIELEIEGSFRDKIKTKTFYDSVVMREGY
ncbi:hypothetical protein KKC45_01105 [Patescibacteria group bacterium]|nr:hypothetical protein [Patescibacteria group bacterium]